MRCFAYVFTFFAVAFAWNASPVDPLLTIVALSSRLKLTAPETALINLCHEAPLPEVGPSFDRATDRWIQQMLILTEALDDKDFEKMLPIIRERKKSIGREVAAIQGGIYVAISRKEGSTDQLKPLCVDAVLQRLYFAYRVAIRPFQKTAELAVAGFKDDNDDQILYNLQKELTNLNFAFDNLIWEHSTKESQTIREKCKALNVDKLKSIVKHLKSRIETLTLEDKEKKEILGTSAVALVFDALTMNTICDAVATADKPNENKQEVMKKNVQLSQKVLDDLLSTVQSIVPAKKFFKSIFGF